MMESWWKADRQLMKNWEKLDENLMETWWKADVKLMQNKLTHLSSSAHYNMEWKLGRCIYCRVICSPSAQFGEHVSQYLICSCDVYWVGSCTINNSLLCAKWTLQVHLELRGSKLLTKFILSPETLSPSITFIDISCCPNLTFVLIQVCITIHSWPLSLSSCVN